MKANTFARAYIYFKNEKFALEFQKAYHGHTFMDRHGNEGKAHVEFAPFQKIPREQRKADAKQGTIEEGTVLKQCRSHSNHPFISFLRPQLRIVFCLLLDPDYIAFLQSLTADPTDAEREMKLSGTEQCELLSSILFHCHAMTKLWNLNHSIL